MKLTHLALAIASIGTCSAQVGIQIRSAGPLPGGPFNDKVVTGKPFTADAEIDSDQTLANGTHIVNKQTVTLARDSQGRTRREETLPAPTADGQQVKTVFISDPVAQVNYVLGPDNVAHKVPFLKLATLALPDSISIVQSTSQSTSQSTQAQGSVTVQSFSTAVPSGAAGPVNLSFKAEPGDSTKESLGTQTINGVRANGTRTTTTIPAGQIGNDSPLVITDERWYSPDLQVTVMTRHSDPRFGDSSYQLTNIQQGEPPESLFEVPSNYTIE